MPWPALGGAPGTEGERVCGEGTTWDQPKPTKNFLQNGDEERQGLGLRDSGLREAGARDLCTRCKHCLSAADTDTASWRGSRDANMLETSRSKLNAMAVAETQNCAAQRRGGLGAGSVTDRAGLVAMAKGSRWTFPGKSRCRSPQCLEQLVCTWPLSRACAHFTPEGGAGGAEPVWAGPVGWDIWPHSLPFPSMAFVRKTQTVCSSRSGLTV